jgi:hypothetical protein
MVPHVVARRFGGKPDDADDVVPVVCGSVPVY